MPDDRDREGVPRPARVLLVDDDPHVRKLTRMLLVLQGFEVDEASSGREALDRFDLERPDVVITDYFLPDENGGDLVARLRAHDPTVPVVVISGGLDAGAPIAKIAGVFGTLQKPFSSEDLVGAIRGALGETG
jgi:DNA-binding NtrC family response regulator